MTRPDERLTSFERDLAATLALALYSLVVAAGFARVFSEWEFLRDLGLLVVMGHGVSFALRRLGVSGWFAIPFISALLLWMLFAIHYADTMTWLFPGDATWDRLDLDLGLVRDEFQTAVAPVRGTRWAALAGFAMIIAIVMADSFAFRAEARGEALVPGGVLFVFISALGTDRLRIALTMALIAAGVVAVVALRAMHDRSRRVELTATRGPASMVIPAALATAAAIAALAGFVGPRIPGAESAPLYDTKGRSGGVTEVVSPLVDIRSRLTNRSNVELFRVNATAPAYWRVTTLPEFDGQTFSLARRPVGQFGDASGEGDLFQQIQVLNLSGELVPAAAEPVQFSGTSMNGERIAYRFEGDTSTVFVPEGLETGDEFLVVSSTIQLGAEQLDAATADAPPDGSIYTELPALPTLVADTAAAVTAGAATPYEQARVLQDWFRSEFDYSLEVQSGHGSNAIESFLTERVGYCEQFSATYAAMIRTLGIPSRVAVGYTPGVLGSDGWYSVRGKHAHAWPEVWFDGVGWVPFEPTPSRGAPGAEAYTGVPPEQDESPVVFPGDASGNTVVVPTAPPTVVAPTTTIARTGPVITDPQTGFPDDFLGGGGGAAPTVGDAEPTSGSGVPWLLLTIVVVLALALVGPAVVRWVRARRARSHGAIDRVHAAWLRARTAAERAGVAGRASMTAPEWASATAAHLPVAARPMTSLAAVVDRVLFAPPGSVDLDRSGSLGATLGHDCELWSKQIDRIATDTLTPLQKAKHYFTDLW